MITRRTILTSARILESINISSIRIIGRRRNAYGSFVSSQNDVLHHRESRNLSTLRPSTASQSSPTAPSASFLILQQRRWLASIRTDHDTEIRSEDDPSSSKHLIATSDDTHFAEDDHHHSVGEKTKSKKKDKASRIQLVQLQELHSKETIKDHFLPLVKRNDVLSLKWVSTLKNQLHNKKSKRKKEPNAYLTHTQTYLQKQSKDIKSAFWELILVANNSKAKRNKAKRKKATPPPAQVELLQKVRQAAVEFPILWSATRKRKLNKTNQDKKAQDDKPYPWKTYLNARSERLAAIHNAKSPEQQEQEARHLAEHLYNSMPKPKYERLMSVFEDHLKACEQDKLPPSPETKRLKRIQVLYNQIRGPLQRYIHLVAADLGDFLYVTVEDDGTNSRGDIVSDPRISESSKTFDGLLDNFVDSFAAIHELLWKEYQSNKRRLEDDDDDRVTKKEDEEEMDIELGDDSEEAVLQSFHDVMSTGTEAITESISKKKKAALKRQPRSYVLFEAINLQDFPVSDSPRTPLLSSTAPALPDFPSSSPNDRLVIIDNLPIDVNENMLMDAYSRCGPIESLRVFNRKPHLDPGRRSVDSKKKIRNPSSQRESWRRPRTPLYAMVLFETAEAARKASSDPLRIFGMVLDRHLIRSYPSKDLTRLYLEDVSGMHEMGAIEYELSQILHPQLYVCLDMDGDQRPASRRSNRNDDTYSNCIIQFQDFEAAYWSYLRLQEKLSFLQDGDCELQWMETPKDAMLYWTRKLNF